MLTKMIMLRMMMMLLMIMMTIKIIIVSANPDMLYFSGLLKKNQSINQSISLFIVVKHI